MKKKAFEKLERHEEIIEAINELIADNALCNHHPIRLEDAIRYFQGVYKEKHIRKAWKEVI